VREGEKERPGAEKRSEQLRFIPVKKSRDEIRRTYANLSRYYDFWGSLTEQKATARALHRAHIENGERILEVAVGTGRVFEQIVTLNTEGENDGIDLSPEMLARARRRLGTRFSNYSLQVADAYALPFAGETFDLIISNYLFDLLPERDFAVVLLEFKRVLKPGGRVVITSMTMGKSWYSRFWEWLARSKGILAGCRPIALAEDMKKAGFVRVDAEYVSQMTFPSLVIRAEKP
jgi:ubiquinone/menaquinone biosynthesis C-methylase UbiE